MGICKSKKLTILIDMDDTIENLLECWVSELNRVYGTSVKYDEVFAWDMSEVFPTLTKTEIYAPLHNSNFWSKIHPLPGSVEYVKRLIDDGHNVYIVTTSHYTDIKNKIENVLAKHFPFISWKNVIITSRKQLINGDILIDDGVHNLEGGKYIKFLMDASHNRSYDAEKNGMLRVYDWKEIYKIIKDDEIATLMKGEC